MHELYIRYSAEEKETIVLSVKRSKLSIVQALKRLGISRRTFYNWHQKYATGGVNALRETPYRRQTTWNRIPDNIRQIVVELSLEHSELTPPESCPFFYWRKVRYSFQNQAFIVFCMKEVYWNVWSMISSLQEIAGNLANVKKSPEFSVIRKVLCIFVQINLLVLYTNHHYTVIHNGTIWDIFILYPFKSLILIEIAIALFLTSTNNILFFYYL